MKEMSEPMEARGGTAIIAGAVGIAAGVATVPVLSELLHSHQWPSLFHGSKRMSGLQRERERERERERFGRLNVPVCACECVKKLILGINPVRTAGSRAVPLNQAFPIINRRIFKFAPTLAIVIKSNK